jgi:hypothetical protein
MINRIKIIITFLAFLLISTISFAQTAYVSPSVVLTDNTGCATTTYTFTQTVGSNNADKHNTGDFCTIDFPVGTDASTCTSGNVDADPIVFTTRTATQITFNLPAGIAKNATFLIILNGITNGESISGIDNATIFCVNNSDPVTNTATYTITTTICPCIDPSGLGAGSITTTAAAISWTENGSATTWDIEYNTSGTFTGTPTVSYNDITNPKSLTGLASGTTYYYQVRSDCNSDNIDVSAWVDGGSFITLCAAPTGLGAGNLTATTADISWTANGVTTWDIEYTTGAFSDVPTVNNTTNNPETVTGLTASTTYNYQVRADCGGNTSAWVDGGNFTTTAAGPTYCTPAPTSVDGSGITRIVFGTIDNSTGIETNNYGDYSAQSNSIDQGALATVNITYTTGYVYYTKIWIDFNDDGVFGNAASGEEIYSGASTSASPTTLVATFTVPAAAPAGSHRMRIGGAYTATSDPCYTGTYASYEDYTIIVTIVTCPALSAISLSNILGTTADIGWTENGSATTWDIEYGVKPHTFDGSEDVDNTTTNPHTLTGLSASTIYEYRVRADCGAGDESSWSDTYEFTTTCASVVAPWSEDFENAGTIPSCWSQGASNSEDWSFANSAIGKHVGNNGTAGGSTTSGNYFAWIDDSTPDNTGTTLESPPIDVSALTTPELSFYLISNNEGSSNVDFSVDVWDGASWNVGHYTHNTNTVNGEWELITVSLSSLTITGDIKLRFIVDEPANTNYMDDVAIDDVDIHEGPTCPEPSALLAGSITATQADLSWTAGGAESQWDIELGAAGFSATGNPTQSGVTNSYTYTGLTADTDYDYYVRAYCGVGDESTWVGPCNFQTTISCPAPSVLGASNIQGTQADLSWTAGGAETQWDIELDLNGFSATGTPTQSGVTNSYTYTGLSADTDYEFYVRAYCGVGDESTWVGPFNFSTPITCPVPSALAASGITATQADLSWTAGGAESQWDIELGANGFSATGTPTQSGVTNSYTYTGLSASNSYDYYVRAYCGVGDESTWVGPYNFSTPCGSITSFPYTQNFDGLTPNNGAVACGNVVDLSSTCWTNEGGDDDDWVARSIATVSSNTGPSADHTGGGNYLYTESSTCYSKSMILTSPIFDVSSLTVPTLNFWYHMYGAAMGSLTVDAYYNGTWHNGLWTLSADQTNNWYEATVYVTAAYGYSDLKFRFTGVTGTDFTSDMAIDDVTVIDGPTCPPLSSLSAANITAITADLGWTVGATETEWHIELGLDGFTPTGVPTQTGITTNPYTYTGLIPGTDYDFYVRAYCGVGDESTWVGPYSFSTTILTGKVYISAVEYNTLKLAFDAINAGTHTGVINVTIGDVNGQTITETSVATLNKSGSGSASYTSITITPGAANIKLVGDLSATEVIKLNLAENVTIDGRQGSVGSTIDLTIENTYGDNGAGAITLFGASNNVIRYCTLKSGNTSTSGGEGTLAFYAGGLGTSGSNNNLIEECHITKSESNMPMHAIAATGYSGRENSNNTISNCAIYDFEKFGVYLGYNSSTEGYNRAWLIEGNTIYQTTAFTGVIIPQIGICIGFPYSTTTTGKSEDGAFTIKDNTIGGSGSGGYWTLSGGVYPVAGIYVNASSDADSITTIDGNVITMFDIENTSGNLGSDAKTIFSGITTYNTKAYIGNTKANTIGSLTDPDNIKFKSTAGAGTNIYMINMYTSGDYGNRIINNVISGIAVTEGSSGGMTFDGIHSNSADSEPSDSIAQNNISYITMTKCDKFYGIRAKGYVCKNRIRDIDFTGYSGTSELTGIYWYGGNVLNRGVENNEIILGKNKAGTSVAVNDKITGVYNTNIVEMYYNSILIEGTSTGSANVIGVYVSAATDSKIQNNLVYIERDGGTGNHYAIYNDMGGAATWTSSNNAYVINSGAKATSYLGYWDATTTSISDLTTWESTTLESNSIFDTPINQPKNTLFPLLATQDNLDVDDPSWLEAGTPTIEEIDIRSNPRDIVTPTIGAYEKVDLVLPVELATYDVICNNGLVDIEWTTVSETNTDYFILQKSQDVMYWQDVENITAAGNSNSLISYSFIDKNISNIPVYYRLQIVDLDGTYKYSNLVVVNCYSGINVKVEIYPNPANNQVNVNIQGINSKEFKISIINASGQAVFVKDFYVSEGEAEVQLDISSLATGLYLIRIIDSSTGETWSLKLIKKKR